MLGRFVSSSTIYCSFKIGNAYYWPSSAGKTRAAVPGLRNGQFRRDEKEALSEWMCPPRMSLIVACIADTHGYSTFHGVATYRVLYNAYIHSPFLTFTKIPVVHSISQNLAGHHWTHLVLLHIMPKCVIWKVFKTHKSRFCC